MRQAELEFVSCYFYIDISLWADISMKSSDKGSGDKISRPTPKTNDPGNDLPYFCAFGDEDPLSAPIYARWKHLKVVQIAQSPGKG
jgi:hypothetical protein